MVVIKKWIGHRSDTGLRPDFMQDELARVPDFISESGSKIAEIAHFDPGVQAVA